MLAPVFAVKFDLHYQFWFALLTFYTSNNVPEQENPEWRKSPFPPLAASRERQAGAGAGSWALRRALWKVNRASEGDFAKIAKLCISYYGDFLSFLNFYI